MEFIPSSRMIALRGEWKRIPWYLRLLSYPARYRREVQWFIGSRLVRVDYDYER